MRIGRARQRRRVVRIAPGEVLYDGPMRLCALSAIPYYGYGFRMFPYAEERPDRMQLRISTIAPAEFIRHLRDIWRGDYENPKVLFDFFVDEVTIELDPPAPFQIGGDSRGERARVLVRALADADRARGLLRATAVGERIEPMFGSLFAFRCAGRLRRSARSAPARARASRDHGLSKRACSRATRLHGRARAAPRPHAQLERRAGRFGACARAPAALAGSGLGATAAPNRARLRDRGR